MVIVDFFGLLLTVIVVGLRYPHYVLIAALLHEVGRIIIALSLHGHIDSISAAGIFGSAQMSNLGGKLVNIMVLLSGAATNYFISSLSGKIGYEPTVSLFNPVSRLKYPFAVINLRLAVLSLFTTLWKIFF